MASFRLEPPESFDFSKPDGWNRWKRRFDQFRVASGLAKEDDAKQVSTLLYCLGEGAEDTLSSTNISRKDRESYGAVVKKLDDYFGVRRNVIFERARFNRRDQLEGETADEYIATLFSLAENCEYGGLKDELIRDRLVVGIRDETLSRQLQLDPELTLQKTTKSIRQREAVKDQQQSLKQSSDADSNSERDKGDINAMKTKKGHQPTQRPYRQRKCFFCGGYPHPREKCPARNSICFACQKQGHHASVCRSKQIEQIQVHCENEEEGLFVDIIGKRLDKAWFAHMLCKHNICFKLDTGAEVTTISQETYQQLGTTPLNKPSKVLYGAGNQPLDVMGQFPGILSHKELHSQQTIFVIKNLKTNVVVDEILAQLAGARVFSKLDANMGFWQIPLSPECRSLTTFITPFGRFHFNKLPFGVSCASELFQRRMAVILEGLEGVLCLVDDVLVFGSDQQEHDRRLRGLLERVNKARVTLNAEKCAFSRKEIKFLGHVVNHRGVHPDPDKTTAIQMMPKPKDVSELRRVLGMINQFNKFSPRFADLTQPLRELLSARNVWQWSPKHDLAFAALKQEITKLSTLALYNPQVATKISTDASSYGLGAVLLQEEQGSWKPVAFASKALTETEQRYAQIEKEALAIVWACNKFSTFILGLHFEIETDHKHLVPLLSTKHLDTLPPRILRFRLQMARYDYAIHHSPGKSLLTADTLSRAPHDMDQPGEGTPTTDSDVEAFVNALVSFTPITSPALNRYHIEQRRDPVCTSLSTFCREGWPNKQMLPESLKAYWLVRNELSIGDCLLLFGCRIVIPSSLQTMTLPKLHEGHLGIQRCRLRAKMAVWWPGLNKQICRIFQNCQVCTKRNQPHTEPMLSPTLPMYPWQKVSSDLFTLKGRNDLLIVDSFSRFPEVVQLSSTSSQTVIGILKSVFARFGIPEILVTDNGPQYASKHMAEFAKSYGFQHTTSSPYYPQGNGQAERTVKTVKTLIPNADNPFLALLNYRATPLSS